MSTSDTDALHAAAVSDAVRHLNRMIAAAHAAGLVVEVHEQRIHEATRRDALPLLDVTVRRTL